MRTTKCGGVQQVTDTYTDDGPFQAKSLNPGAWLSERNFAAADVLLRVAYGPPNGPPLLCIHGVGRAWRDFAPLLPAFLPAWSIVAPDLRGHGGSTRRTGQYLIRDFLGDVKSLLRQLE